MFASFRFAFERSHPLRSALTKFFCRTHSVYSDGRTGVSNMASDMSANAKSAPFKFASRRSANARSANAKSVSLMSA